MGETWRKDDSSTERHHGREDSDRPLEQLAQKFLKPGSVLLLSFSSSPIELLLGAVDRPRSKQLESQTLNTKYKMYWGYIAWFKYILMDKKYSIEIDNSYDDASELKSNNIFWAHQPSD